MTTKTQKILELVDGEMPVKAAARKLGTSPSLYYQAVKKRKMKGNGKVSARAQAEEFVIQYQQLQESARKREEETARFLTEVIESQISTSTKVAIIKNHYRNL